jgi:uncharacterized protein (DUF1778 family)
MLIGLDQTKFVWHNGVQDAIMQITIFQEKSVRLSCRIRPRVKAQAEEAARLLGLSITDFAESALEDKARAVLAENERLEVSERAFEALLAAISGVPATPSPKLLEAVTLYNEHAEVARRS